MCKRVQRNSNNTAVYIIRCDRRFSPWLLSVPISCLNFWLIITSSNEAFFFGRKGVLRFQLL
jgi:hypothetical protein